MPEKILILYIPVIHKGYLDFLIRVKNKVSKIFIIDRKLQEELLEIKPDIASLDEKNVKDLLGKLGFANIQILAADNIGGIKSKEIILVQDEISRNLAEKYLKGEKIEWDSAFLRWDKEKVLADIPTENIAVSEDNFDIEMMKEASKEAQKSGDWWRQVGAVAVKDNKIIARGYNQGPPTDNTPYQLGSLRDLFKAGEKQEFSPTIHAEQKIVAEAARTGLSLDDASLYITHFSCPLCAKLVAFSGIKKLYFSEGAANLDGKMVLESSGVAIIRISL